MSTTNPPISLYVHWPFCEKKCPYCDFNSHVRSTVDQQSYTSALLSELDWFAKQIPQKNLRSIFFGGGTPSLMSPHSVREVINRACIHWQLTPDFEITLEANPGSSEAAKFRGFARAGVNRLSLGVQSFREEGLFFLGRVHNVKEAKAAITLARDHFPRFSFDMIYGRPDQSVKMWRDELEEALSWSDGHLSLYQLTLESNTAFYQRAKRGEFILPHEDEAAQLFEETRAICLRASLPAYEISNHARPGMESLHNLAYWQGRPFVGIGPGAHSRLKNGTWLACATLKSPEAWLSAVQEKNNGIEITRPLLVRERAEEVMMTSLRLSQGLEKQFFLDSFGQSAFTILNQQRWTALKDRGLVAETKTHLHLTERGLLLLDWILSQTLGISQGD